MSMSWFLEGAAAGGNGLLISIDTLPFRIGRDASCELPVASRDISRIHAKIERTGEDGLRVTDLGSTNGTFVNGRFIKRQRLLHNDTIEFGGCLLRYLANELPDEDERWTPTRVAPPTSLRGPEASASATVSLGLIAPTHRVKVLTGETAGQEMVLTKVVTTVGKPGVLLASITRRPSGCVLSHVEGPGRARVNDLDMQGDVMPLRDGDLIELAGTRMQFFSR
jgi:hypothetical protein